MSEKFRRGIIQSRGLGDIIIALPIARHYYDQGEEIVWPICREFYPSFKDSAAWVSWVPIDTDEFGNFFLNTPLQVFKDRGVDQDEALYLYQYLNTAPELTDPEMFAILKFDQYKYQTSAVPFLKKWTLRNCITRNRGRESEFAAKLNLPARYAVTHLHGSSFHADIPVSWLDPAVDIIAIDEKLTDNIWDWLAVIEGAEAFVGIDSVFANMVDQMQVAGPELYWIRRSPWDLTPVLGESWKFVPTSLSTDDVQRVNPRKATEEKTAQVQQQQAAQRKPGDPVSHVPFQAQGNIPTSFMSALKPSPGGTGNLMTPPTQPQPTQQNKKSNPALDLYKSLGVRVK
jgi:hypothetical protein